MTLLELESRQDVTDSRRMTVALCGSFRRDQTGLALALEALRTRFTVLSPKALDFVDPDAAFVRLPSEVDESAEDIEARHLAAMTEADLVWLHAPEGYVGTSAAMELGHAMALGIPVFGSTLPSDPVLAAGVRQVDEPAQIEALLVEDTGLPGRGIDRLQRYYRRAALRRGWSEESAKDTVLLLTEELGELARAVRKLEGLARHQEAADTEVAGELADVQLYLVHLANTLGFDLSDAVTQKERVNAQRFERSRDVA